MMFQGPKGYIVQICEVHLQYGNSTTKWPFYTFFLLNSSLYILFSMGISFCRKSKIIVKRKPNYEIGWFHN